MIRTHDAGTLRAEDVDTEVVLAGWVARRRDHGGVAFIDLREASGVVQVVIRDEAVAHNLRNEFCLKVTGTVSLRPEGNQNAALPTGEIEVIATDVEVLSSRPHSRSRSTTHRQRRRRGGPPPAPLPGPAPYGSERRPAPARQGQQGGPRRPRRARLRRGGDPHPDPVHARGRSRLPGPGTTPAGQLVRPAAEPPAVQAAADGRGHGALLPDRALLPGRGLPRRPAARVHPARHRDELRRAGRRHRADRGDPHGALGADRPRGADPAAAPDVRRGDGPVRLRQARPADGPRARRLHRLLLRHPVPCLPGAVRRSRGHAGRGEPAAQAARRLAGVGQAARRPGPGLPARQGGRRADRPGVEEHLRGGEGRDRRSTSAPVPGTASSSRPDRSRAAARSSVPPGSRSAAAAA